LNRDLETIDFQSGIDLGKRGLLSENDILIFGALGGFVHADLDYTPSIEPSIIKADRSAATRPISEAGCS
jgi:hypothetical protein